MRQTEAPNRWDEFDAWLDYYEAYGIEAIGFGLIAVGAYFIFKGPLS